MHWLALGITLLVALAIVAIGIGYVASPTTVTRVGLAVFVLAGRAP